MARIDEIAIGIVQVLHSSKLPEPLLIELWGQSPVDALVLVRAVIAESQRVAAPLSAVRIGPQLGRLVARELVAGMLDGVRVEIESGLDSRVHFFRSPQSGFNA